MKPLFPSFCFALAAALFQPAVTAHAQSGILLKNFDVKAAKLLLDPHRPRLYATVPADNSIAVIDTDTNTVTTTFFIGSNPVDLSVSPDGTRLYVANGGSTAAGIGVVNLDTLTTLPSLPAPFAPVSIAAGLGNRVYVVGGGYSTGTTGVAQIDGSTGTLQTSFGGSPGYQPVAIKLSPDASILYVAGGTNGLTTYDVSTATSSKRLTANSSDEAENLQISHDGKSFVNPVGSGDADNYGTALHSTLDLTSVLGTFNTGAYPSVAIFSADDALLYQVEADGGSNGQSRFKVFSTMTFTQLDSFVDPNPLSSSGYGTNPTSLAITAPHGYLYVAQTDGTFDNPPGKLELLSTQRAPFFDGSVMLSNGFYYLKFSDGVPFGYYNFNFTPYLYHNDLGFEYPFDAADGQGGIYLYDFKSSTFFYTSSSLFPYLYDFKLNTFLYYYPDPTRADHYNTNGVRYFYNFASGKIISK